MQPRRLILALGTRLLGATLGLAAAVPPLAAVLRRRTSRALAAGDCLFLCHGNLNRSAFAAALARQLHPDWRIGEAGTQASSGAVSSQLAVAAATRWDVDLGAHHATRLDAQLACEFPAIIAFDARNLIELALSHPRTLRRAHLLGWLAQQGAPTIADPHGGPAASYERAFAAIASALHSESSPPRESAPTR
jgi:protein-tyrosine-phosphatase